MTPHINAKEGDIAKLVLMVGDPLRAKLIAEKYLNDVKQVNTVRNMFSYTGYYKDKRITIFSHGMGIPSVGIYSYELYNFYGVECIIRLGTAGSYTSKLDVKDLVLVKESYSVSTYAKDFYGETEKIMYPSKKITEKIGEIAKKNQINLLETRIFSTDVFYSKDDITDKMREDFGCDAVEMETFGLFSNAKFFNKGAAAILTISDSFVSNKKMTSDERANSFENMVELALETALIL